MPTYTLYADATRHEGKRYTKGDQIELDEKVGKRLQEQGLVGPADSEPPEAAQPMAVGGTQPLAAERSTTGPSQVRLADDEDPRARSRISSGGQVAAAAADEVVSDVPNVETATGEEVAQPKATKKTASSSSTTESGASSTRKR